MPVSRFIRSTASAPFTAPPLAGVTVPVTAVVFASKAPPIVIGQTTVTSPLVIRSASCARAESGNAARQPTTNPTCVTRLIPIDTPYERERRRLTTPSATEMPDLRRERRRGSLRDYRSQFASKSPCGNERADHACTQPRNDPAVTRTNEKPTRRTRQCCRSVTMLLRALTRRATYE